MRINRKNKVVLESMISIIIKLLKHFYISQIAFNCKQLRLNHLNMQYNYQNQIRKSFYPSLLFYIIE